MEGSAAGANMIEPRSRKVSYDAIPSVVFTHPQMASVGMTTDEAREAGFEVNVSSGRLDSWASSLRLGGVVGYYETVVDAKSGRILGAHIASAHAGEQINALTLAIRHGVTADEYRSIPWAYPTFTSELQYIV
jgi:glutathione reductase (NADPH)